MTDDTKKPSKKELATKEYKASKAAEHEANAKRLQLVGVCSNVRKDCVRLVKSLATARGNPDEIATLVERAEALDAEITLAEADHAAAVKEHKGTMAALERASGRMEGAAGE